MKVVMLSKHGCMRVMKMALPLMEKGHEVHLIVGNLTNYSECFKTVTVFQDVNQLYNAIKLHKDADIFHAHNEPSWFVTVAKETFPKKPVVLDVHDSFLLRRSPNEELETKKSFRVSVDERNNFQLADGLVYVGPAMKEIVHNEFKLDQPNIILPSYVPERFNRIDFLQWIGGLVYEGRIDFPGELPKEWDVFGYSTYIKLAEKCKELEIDFHIYTPRKNKKAREIYNKVCYLAPEPLGFYKLIRNLGCHDWGLVGNIDYHEEWKHALPNKLFEYISGCVPIVSINADESSKVIEEHDIGITVGSMEELSERWPEHREKRKNLIKKRHLFAMEAHIGKLEKLYRELLG